MSKVFCDRQKIQTSYQMVIYNEYVPKMGCQSSVVIDNHIIKWLIEDSLVP